MADDQRQDLERRRTVWVGVTGHQRLGRPEAWGWVRNAIADALASLRPLIGVTSLAVGADQLFARLVLERGGDLRAVLPFADIERSFAAEDLPAYRDLASRAKVEVLATPGTDEDSYLAAGCKVVDLSDLVLAVWDGGPARGRGGTAEIVAYALGRGVPVVHVDPAWGNQGGA